MLTRPVDHVTQDPAWMERLVYALFSRFFEGSHGSTIQILEFSRSHAGGYGNVERRVEVLVLGVWIGMEKIESDKPQALDAWGE